jgi:hypothetical protein
MADPGLLDYLDVLLSYEVDMKDHAESLARHANTAVEIQQAFSQLVFKEIALENAPIQQPQTRRLPQ